MNDNYLAAVRINQDLCSRCKVCYSLCPFEAIERHPEEGKLSINIQKCQVCGICYSACPASAIETLSPASVETCVIISCRTGISTALPFGSDTHSLKVLK